MDVGGELLRRSAGQTRPPGDSASPSANEAARASSQSRETNAETESNADLRRMRRFIAQAATVQQSQSSQRSTADGAAELLIQLDPRVLHRLQPRLLSSNNAENGGEEDEDSQDAKERDDAVVVGAWLRERRGGIRLDGRPRRNRRSDQQPQDRKRTESSSTTATTNQFYYLDIGRLLSKITRLQLVRASPDLLLGIDRLCAQLTELWCQRCQLRDVARVLLEPVWAAERRRKGKCRHTGLTFEEALGAVTCTELLSSPDGGADEEQSQTQNDQEPKAQGQCLWPRLARLNVAHNALTRLNQRALRECTQLTDLDLSHNAFSTVPPELNLLYNLRRLSMAHNLLVDVRGLNRCLGSVTVLNLSHNQLVDTRGLEKLWALQALDLRWNQMEVVSELAELAVLPELVELAVVGNPVANLRGTRAAVVAAFQSGTDGNRWRKLILDGQRVGLMDRMGARLLVGRGAVAANSASDNDPDRGQNSSINSRNMSRSTSMESVDSAGTDIDQLLVLDSGKSSGINTHDNSNEVSRRQSPTPQSKEDLPTAVSDRTAGAAKRSDGFKQPINIAARQKSADSDITVIVSPSATTSIISARSKRRVGAASKPRQVVIADEARPMFASAAGEMGDGKVRRQNSASPSVNTSSIPTTPETRRKIGRRLGVSAAMCSSYRPTAAAEPTAEPSARKVESKPSTSPTFDLSSLSTSLPGENYRRKLNALKQAAGSDWLKVFSEMQQPPPPRPSQQSENRASVVDAQPVSDAAESSQEENVPPSEEIRPSSADTHGKRVSLLSSGLRETHPTSPSTLSPNSSSLDLPSIESKNTDIIAEEAPRELPSLHWETMELRVIVDDGGDSVHTIAVRNELVIESGERTQQERQLNNLYSVKWFQEQESLKLDFRHDRRLTPTIVHYRLHDRQQLDLGYRFFEYLSAKALENRPKLVDQVTYKLKCARCGKILRSQLPLKSSNALLSFRESHSMSHSYRQMVQTKADKSKDRSSIYEVNGELILKQATSCVHCGSSYLIDVTPIDEPLTAHRQSMSSDHTIQAPTNELSADEKAYESERKLALIRGLSRENMDVSLRLHLQLNLFAPGEQLLAWVPTHLVFHSPAPYSRFSKFVRNLRLPEAESATNQFVFPVYFVLSNRKFYVFTWEATKVQTHPGVLAMNDVKKMQLLIGGEFAALRFIQVGYLRQSLQLSIEWLQLSPMSMLPKYRSKLGIRSSAPTFSCSLLLHDSGLCNELLDAWVPVLFEQERSNDVLQQDCSAFLAPFLATLEPDWPPEQIPSSLIPVALEQFPLFVQGKIMDFDYSNPVNGAGKWTVASLVLHQKSANESQFWLFPQPSVLLVDFAAAAGTWVNPIKVDAVLLGSLDGLESIRKIRQAGKLGVIYGLQLDWTDADDSFVMYFPTPTNVEVAIEAIQRMRTKRNLSDVRIMFEQQQQ